MTQPYRCQFCFLNHYSFPLYSRSVLHFLHGKPPLSYKFISEDSLFPVRCGIALNPQFCCRVALDSAITRIQSSGLYGKFMDDELYKKWLETSASMRTDGDTRKISVGDVLGVLVMLVAGYLVSVAVLAAEVCLYHFETREKGQI